MTDTNYKVGMLTAINNKLTKSEGILSNICSVSDNTYLYYDFKDKEVNILGNWNKYFDIDADSSNTFSYLKEYIQQDNSDDFSQIFYPENYGLNKADIDFYIQNKDMFVHAVSNVHYDHDGQPLWKVIEFSDITKSKQTYEELTYMAYYDSLTGLYNRNYFVLTLGEMLRKASESNNIVSVLFIDIDDFRKVNDGLGLTEGDDVIQHLGLFLKELMDDNIIASHFNSDIFSLAIYDPIGKRSVNSVVESIRSFMKKPMSVIKSDGSVTELTLTVSIGIAEFPESSDKALDLINLAEIVMLKAKQRKGKNNVQYYDKPIIEEFIGNIEIEKKLNKALKEQDFYMCYQPQFDTSSRKLRGVEALVRWREEDGNVISPETFIPIAERNGSILMLGDWIIEESLSDYSKWISNHSNLDRFLISINVSSLQFKNKNFVKYLISIIKKYNLNPENIELEITESVFIDNMEDMISKMKLLKDFGLRFSMDDFGTGFSSLSYLKELPIDTLKIDKSFIDNVVNDCSTRTIAESIIDLSKKLGFDTIAEGVEEEVQYSLLKNIGCENIQGYYLGKPMEYDEIDQLLKKYD